MNCKKKTYKLKIALFATQVEVILNHKQHIILYKRSAITAVRLHTAHSNISFHAQAQRTLHGPLMNTLYLIVIARMESTGFYSIANENWFRF